MAAIVATSAFTTGNGTTLNATAPTGIQVGDMLVAFVMQNVEEVTITTPSGWTSGYGTAFNNYAPTYFFYKVAVSGDTSASTYAFTSGSSTGKKVWIGRLTGVAGTAPELVVESTSGNGVTSNPWSTDLGTQNPTYPNNLLFGAFTILSGSRTLQTVAIGTDNPTWTEYCDDATDDYLLGVHGGTRAGIADYGSYAFTLTGGVANINFGIGLFVSFGSATAITWAPDALDASATLFAPSWVANLTWAPSAVALTPTINAFTIDNEASAWSNTDKSSSTWTNTVKS